MLSAGAARPPVTHESDEAWFSRWRQRELGRLDTAGLTYLDYTGATPHPVSLIRTDSRRLEGAILGNPHSEHLASRHATRDLEAAREAILAFLNADPLEYAVVLTPNASGGCRLVGEAYPWGPNQPLVLGLDNHNSVNGMAEFARRRGAPVRVVPLDAELRMAGALEALGETDGGGGLVAFPAQSNFSGVRHPLSLIAAAQSSGYRVLLDAAAFLPTASLDLALVHPDYVALSIYKIAGYPTGIGALVVRHDALASLERPWFAGGTVDWVSVGLGRHRLRSGVERFEDGTPPFLAAGAVPEALAVVTAADRPRLGRYLVTLSTRLLEGLTALRHGDGRTAVTVHGPQTTVDRGATVALTLHGADGRSLPYWAVEEAARNRGLAVRGGCFCNPGCAERAFGMHPALVAPCFEALGEEFTIPKFAACFGGPVGAVRVSLGLGSISADVERTLSFIAELTGAGTDPKLRVA
ncbi:MAG: aminotransferase class V-fold PLP-dependent enzyme [Gemmatimonadota bacterium]